MKNPNDDYIKLTEIANIYSGLFTKRIELKSPNKSFKYLTIPNKALNDNYINPNEFETLYSDKKIDEKYIAQYNDIIMKLSPPYNVAIINFKEDNVVVPLNCGIIRVNNHNYIPIFLSYILNSNKIKKQLSRLVEGSGIKIMKIQQVKDIKIKKIPLKTQKKYEKLFVLLNKKKKLLERKLELEEQFTKNIINNLI
ncbi:hypothetical protein [Methanobrevibacter sp. DSM 116169]|uniref:hypothetical protein n=1 Tax=Methanobrevibacter sp. DSM 116169 TaxID=3242727 RepID=UPI0038FC394F